MQSSVLLLNGRTITFNGLFADLEAKKFVTALNLSSSSLPLSQQNDISLPGLSEGVSARNDRTNGQAEQG